MISPTILDLRIAGLIVFFSLSNFSDMTCFVHLFWVRVRVMCSLKRVLITVRTVFLMATPLEGANGFVCKSGHIVAQASK